MYVVFFSIPLLFSNKNNCAGVYDEMRVLEVEDPAEPVRTNLTAAEEEALLYGSDKEGEPGDARGSGEQGGSGGGGPDDEETERKRAEREADEADLLAKQAELAERIRRRKAEREKKLEEQRKLERELLQSEKNRLREEAESEKMAHRKQIEKLEAELKQAREAAEKREDTGEGCSYQKRGRTGSEDSRHESTATSFFGTNMLNLPAGYRAVRSAKLNSLAVRHLNGGSAIPYKPIGSFANDRDARIRLANTISDASSSRNISSSFNLETFICNTCTTRGEHTVLGKKVDGDDGSKQAPPCFVLSDQNFPSVIPVEGEGDCFKILQVENASLTDLTTVFLAALEGFTVPAGSVVLLSSVSHLAAVGTAAYAEDLVRAYKAVRAVYGNGITVMHGIPLLLSGLHCYSIA